MLLGLAGAGLIAPACHGCWCPVGTRSVGVCHLSTCLQETPVPQDDFGRTESGWVVKETHDRSFVSGCWAAVFVVGDLNLNQPNPKRLTFLSLSFLVVSLQTNCLLLF